MYLPQLYNMQKHQQTCLASIASDQSRHRWIYAAYKVDIQYRAAGLLTLILHKCTIIMYDTLHLHLYRPQQQPPLAWLPQPTWPMKSNWRASSDCIVTNLTINFYVGPFQILGTAGMTKMACSSAWAHAFS